MSSLTCPLCGLRYPARSLLDLHIREDHAQRDAKPAAPAAKAQAPRPRTPPRHRRGPNTPAGLKPPGAPSTGCSAGPPDHSSAPGSSPADDSGAVRPGRTQLASGSQAG